MDIDTILSEEERSATSSEEESEVDEMPNPSQNDKAKSKKNGKAKSKQEKAAKATTNSLLSDLGKAFGAEAEDKGAHSWDFTNAIAEINKDRKGSTKQTTLDDKIRRAVEARRQKQGEEKDDDSDDGSSESSDSEADDESKKGATRPLTVPASSAAIFREQERIKQQQTRATSFAELQLSRPLLRAVQALNYESPTPIQADAIPIILQGKDVLGSAVTGSGKTAAYLLPVVERLLLRDRRSGPLTRVLVVVPTRELAQQVSSMLEKLSQYCNDITQTVVVGGLSTTTQALALRARPDVIIATPGRLIDHLRNTVSFDIADLEILILDEADRLLELGFADELREIIRYAPKQRQTMLFSATMSSDVTKLAELSLDNPARIATDPLFDVAQRLVQEFVRVRTMNSALPAKELAEEQMHRRLALLLALCTHTAKTRVIIFFQHKHQAHRTCISFGLLGLKCAELHGNLTQAKRLEALQRFRDGDVDFLFCTDLAARGIDIAGVQCVINFELPKDLTTYIHRVGRTARAGRGGRAISLVGDERRSTMRELLKSSSSSQFQSRTIATSTATKCYEQIKQVQKEVESILQEEKLEREMRLAEMDATKAENMVVHRDEIMSRPKKTWFQSGAAKLELKQKAKEAFESAGGEDRKEQEEEEEEFEEEEEKPKTKEEKRERLGNRAKRRREALREREEREAQKAEKELKRASDEVDESTKKKLKLAIVPSEMKQKVIAKTVKKKSRNANGQMQDEDGDPINLDEVSARKAKASLGGGSKKANFVEKRSRYAEDTTNFKTKSLAVKLRKGGKKSVHSFKSKQKYKRR